MPYFDDDDMERCECGTPAWLCDCDGGWNDKDIRDVSIAELLA